MDAFFAEDTRAAGSETRPDQVRVDGILVGLVIFPVRSAPSLAGKELSSTPSEDRKQMKLISAPALFWF